jgi:hypothetical protein
MTPNFDEGIDKTHSIGVPGFVGEPESTTEQELEILRDKLHGRIIRYTGGTEQINSIIALVRAYDARQLRELPKDIISEADGCGYEQCSYCYPELVLDENGKVIKIEDVEKLADELEGK